MAAGDQVPLVGGLLQSAQEDVFALPGVDLAEDRFDDGLAAGVNELLPSLFSVFSPSAPARWPGQGSAPGASGTCSPCLRRPVAMKNSLRPATLSSREATCSRLPAEQ